MDDRRAQTHRRAQPLAQVSSSPPTQLRRRPPHDGSSPLRCNVAADGVRRPIGSRPCGCEVGHCPTSAWSPIGHAGPVQPRRPSATPSPLVRHSRTGMDECRARASPSLHCGTRRGIATTCGVSGTIDAGREAIRALISLRKALSLMSLIQYATSRFFLLPGLSPGPRAIGAGVMSPSSVDATR